MDGARESIMPRFEVGMEVENMRKDSMISYW